MLVYPAVLCTSPVLWQIHESVQQSQVNTLIFRLDHSDSEADVSRSSYQSSNPIGQCLIHKYICKGAIAITMP